MDTPVDLMSDSLADATLSPEQRRIWELTRAELLMARAQIQEFELRINTLEKKMAEDGFVHTVLTRPEFNREVARMLAFDERYGGVSSILYFDFENLTDIINQFGRSVANTAVRALCDALIKQIRRSDIVGRLATDEFGVLLARCDNANAWKKGEKIAAELQQTLALVHDCAICPIIGFGAYTFDKHEDLATGLKHVAESVTRAKNET